MQTGKVTLAKSGSDKSQEEIHQLSILFIEGAEAWSAQCLEFDIACQAKTLNALFYEMERVLVSQIALDAELGRKPFEGIGPAPDEYWDSFKRSQTQMVRPATGLKSTTSSQHPIRPTIRVAELAA